VICVFKSLPRNFVTKESAPFDFSLSAQGDVPGSVSSPEIPTLNEQAPHPQGLRRWRRGLLAFASLGILAASPAGWVACHMSPSCDLENTKISGSSTVAVGSHAQLVLGNTCDPSETGVTWSASPAGYLSIDSNGNITGLSATPPTPEGGAVTVTAKDTSGNAFTATVTVSGPTLTGIAVTDEDKGTVGTGATDPFTATGMYSDSTTQNLTTFVTWTSGTTTVATIVANTGVVTTVATGSSLITASLAIGSAAPITGSETLTVMGVAPTLTGITIAPATASITAGLTQQYTATGTYSDGSQQPITTGLTWIASPVTVATITSSGLATGVSAGSASIMAVLGTVTSQSAALTVTGATLQSISVTPASAFIIAGQTQQYTATGTYSDGSTQPLSTAVAWTSSPTAVATIVANGLATGVAQGTATISASDGAVNSGPVTLTVLPASRYLLDLPSVGLMGVEAIVPGTGQLRARSIVSGVFSGTFQILPDEKNVILVEPDAGTIANFSIGAGGQIAPTGAVLSDPSWAEDNLASTAVDPLGRFVYVADDYAHLTVIPVDSSGNLGAPVLLLSNLINPTAMAIDPSGTYLYVASSGQPETTIGSYKIGASGAVTAVATSSGLPYAGIDQFLVSPSGNVLYALDKADFLLSAFSLSSGVLTPLPNSPFSLPSGGTPQAIAIDPTGSYVYLTEAAEATTGDNTDGLFGFTASADGLLIPMQLGFSFPVGQAPTGMIADAAGQFLYVANNGSNEIWVYSIASGNAPGQLTKVGAIRAAYPNQLGIVSGPSALSFTPSQLYVTNATGSGTITQFTIDPASGNLSNLSAPVAAGVNPQAITTDPFGQYAFAGGLGANDVSAYSVSDTGLSPITGSPFPSGNEPTALATDLSGSYLYAAMQGSADHTVWVYDLVSGVPTNGQAAVDTDAQPVFITGEPSNQFIYVANFAGHSIDMYQIYGDTLLSDGPGSLSVGQSQNWISVDPSGRFAYSADPLSNTIWEFNIAANGLLTVNGSQSVGVASSNPGVNTVVVEPTGKYLYATNEIAGQIFAFTIEPSTGLLTPVVGNLSHSEVGDLEGLPSAMSVDISGKYLYCVYSQSPGSGAVAAYSIDLNTGFLTAVTGAPYVPFAVGIATAGAVQ
jgi:6-phosphogluconolactonase (cycloisomerase 2 family)